jgi:hypothetical protein
VPKGKVGEGEGWKRFGEELHFAFNSLHAGNTSYSKHLHVKEVSQPKPKSEMRRCFVEVLRASLPKFEEPVVPPNRTPALAGIESTYSVTEKDIQARAKSPEKLHVEIMYCLKGLHLLEDDLLGSGPKLPGPGSLPRT